MKHTLFSLFLLNFFLFSNLKAQFSPAIIIDDQQEEFTSLIKVADFNNDGLNDILTVADQFPLDVVKIYYNEGNNVFSPVLIEERDNIVTVDVADLNGDTWIDFAIISDNGTEANLSWYENQQGNFERHFLANVDWGMNKVILKDFNNDGMTDILSLEHTVFVLRKAINPGVFDDGETFANPTEYYAMNANDYNNDGFLDVSVASATGFLVFLNNSGNSFSHFSNAGSSIVFGLESADLDQDGDMDIVSYDTLQGLRLYTNDGNANFTFHSTILDSSDDFSIFGLVDLNCDGLPDLHTVISQAGQAVWIENQGFNMFSAPILIHDFDGLIYASGNGDLNNDDAPDLIFGRDDLGIALNECAGLTLVENVNLEIQFYPNPVHDFLYFTSKDQNFEVQVLDETGRLVRVQKVTNGKLSLKTLPSGLYFLKSVGFPKVIKVIKQ